MNRSLYPLVAVAVLTACDTPTVPEPYNRPVPVERIGGGQQQGDPALLQTKIVQRIASRAARGLPTPLLKLDFQSPQGTSMAQLRRIGHQPGSELSYTATTIVLYRGPRDAGLERWPAMTLTPEQSRKLGVTSEEVQARYVAAREAASPGFWQRYELGLEPRTYTIVEHETRRYRARQPGPYLSEDPVVALDVSSQGDLVFGFQVPLPELKKNVSFGFEDVEELKLSFEAFARIAIRLPTAGQIGSPEPLLEGSTYAGTSTITGQNWSGDQYSGVGLPAEDGHEALVHAQVEACVELSGVVDDGPHCEGPEINEFKDFTTPLGLGNALELPDFNYPIVDFGVAGVDFNLSSAVGSDKITGDWNVSGEAMGGGLATYTNSATAISLPDVYAIDGPGTAAYLINNFQYYVNQFVITPGVRLWVDVEIPILPDWEDSFTIPILSIDLGDLIPGLELAIPIHNAPYTGGSSLATSAAILNVAPTADMTVAGGTLVVINGIPTIMGTTGANFTFTGDSHDPGRDDLTLSWDWGDGAPVPDVSTLYALGAPTGPNNAQDVQVHAFGRSCLYRVTFKSVDDDAAFATDDVEILVTETGNPARLEGFWQKQLGRTGGNLLDVAVVECFLRIVDRVSLVFSEARAASTLAEAFVVSNLPRNEGGEDEQLDRELLIAWMNFAAGAVGYLQLVDTNDDGTPDTPFVQVMQAAEAVRLDPTATATALRFQTERVHQVSQQFTGRM